MPRISFIVFVLLDCIFLVLSILIILMSLLYQAAMESSCVEMIHLNLVLAGSIVTFVLSFIGLLGICCKGNWLMNVYSFLTLLWIIICSAFLIFLVILTTGKADGSDHGYNPAKAHNIINHYVNGRSWDNIRDCLHIFGKLCDKIIHNEYDPNLVGPDQLRVGKYSWVWSHTGVVVQLACCIPPRVCGFLPQNITMWVDSSDDEPLDSECLKMVNNTESPVSKRCQNVKPRPRITTIWVVPETGRPAVVPDRDCMMWSNQPQMLCSNCNVCKGAVLNALRKPVRFIAFVIGWALMILALTCIVGSHAKRNNVQIYQKEKRKDRVYI